jgi:hypothetical protein
MNASRPAVELRRLWWIGPVTVLAAVLAVLFVRVLAFAALDLSPEFPPLTWTALILFTTVLVTGGVLVFAVVARLAASPLRLYRRIAFVALVASLIPDLFLPGSGPGATWVAAIVLMAMHVAAWLPTVAILTRWTVRRNASGPENAGAEKGEWA